MKVLLIGSGGREHALAFTLRKSRRISELFVAPGNAGTAALGENVVLDVADHQAVVDFCRARAIDLVVVGPEGPLVDGIADTLRSEGVAVFGPSKAAAQLEGSKGFTKALCDEMGIPTAGYGRFSSEAEAIAYLRRQGAPIVVKADGLASGKGVTVALSLAEAEQAVRDCFSGSFGAAGAEVVIEEFLEGEEASIFAVCDGERSILLASAQDHKRAYDGDNGPNTGGMGAYSPAPVMTPDMLERTRTEIIEPTIRGMKARGTPFSGVLFAGLMITPTGPKLIEYNVRFGDPECQVLMMRLSSDLLDLLEGAAKGHLSAIEVSWKDEVALTVVLAAKGYPGNYAKGSEIRGADEQNSQQVQVFHAGTSWQGKRLIATGGRVLNVTALGSTVAEAQSRAYAALDRIVWPEGYCRRDIGWRAIAETSL